MNGIVSKQLKLGSALLSVFLAHAASSSEIARELIGQRFTIDVPLGYQEIIGPQIPGAGVVAFASAPRQDRTSAMVQISFAYLPKLREKSGISSVEEFGTLMISGVERRRQHWKMQMTDQQLGNMAVKRYEWSGVVSRQNKEVRMFGVMYVGIQGTTAFSLHTQDLEQYAKNTLPEGERSMKTFRLLPPSPP